MMTQEGYNEFVRAKYDIVNGTANSYIQAIRIIDELFTQKGLFSLNGKSITCIDDKDLLSQIVAFVCKEQSLYKKGDPSFFSNVKTSQTSYPQRGFCSAAVKQLLNYHEYELEEQKATDLIRNIAKGSQVSKELISFFKIDKEGKDAIVDTRKRIGQSYFRKMVLANYDNKCCVTGLNVPQTLRASHIVAWADSKPHRMDPENGLCLSATYDAAFDKHLISFDEDYRMIISKEIKDHYTNDATKEYFYKYEGIKLTMPQVFMPSQKLLQKHRELMVG